MYIPQHSIVIRQRGTECCFPHLHLIVISSTNFSKGIPADMLDICSAQDICEQEMEEIGEGSESLAEIQKPLSPCWIFAQPKKRRQAEVPRYRILGQRSRKHSLLLRCELLERKFRSKLYHFEVPKSIGRSLVNMALE